MKKFETAAEIREIQEQSVVEKELTDIMNKIKRFVQSHNERSIKIGGAYSNDTLRYLGEVLGFKVNCRTEHYRNDLRYVTEIGW